MRRIQSSVVVLEDDDFAVAISPNDRAEGNLTAAERAVVELAARGFSNAEIARARGTALRTVTNQMASALAKLGLPSRVALGAWWGQGGNSGRSA
jgi:DNA-binding NarL/FixJ family response regulator